MKNTLNLTFFIDALGWRIVQEHKFCKDLLPDRRKIRTQFGYSSGAVPTILSGKTPAEHGHFSCFYYSPETSPFHWMRFLPLFLMPDVIFDRYKVKRQLAKFIRWKNKYTGYFELYQMPYDHLPVFDYTEKTDIFAPGGLAPVRNLADVWTEQKKEYHISNWHLSSGENIRIAEEVLRTEKADSVFLYTAEVDGFLHFNVNDFDAVSRKLAEYETHIEKLLAIAREHYKEIRFHVISDHGMAPLRGTIDLRPRFADAGLRFGKDCAWVLDSTMARFWFLRDGAKDAVFRIFDGMPGHFLDEKEKESLGILFPGGRYGEEIFLCDPGIQISPCDMGGKPLPGMHGYSPDDLDSDAVCLSLAAPDVPVNTIGDFFRMMTETPEC